MNDTASRDPIDIFCQIADVLDGHTSQEMAALLGMLVVIVARMNLKVSKENFLFIMEDTWDTVPEELLERAKQYDRPN